MLGNILLWLVLLLVTLGLGWLALRAFRARNALVKWVGGLLAALLTLVIGLVTVVALLGLFKLYMPIGSPVKDLTIEITPERVARGEHLANTFCVGCHSPTGDLPMIGGVDLGADLGMPLGQFISVNLTPAGPLAGWSDGEVLRILREGAAPDGRRLIMMGAARARYMSDEDLYSVIAYLRSQAPVENDTPQPPDSPTLLAGILAALGMVPIEPPVTGSISAPPMGATAEYGAYVVSFQDCVVCHGVNLDGNPSSPIVPAGPDLAVVKGWTAEQFLTTFRTGVDPSGHQLSEAMPWRQIARLDDVELTAVYEYLISLP
ncbi:MAG: cytochrome c [Anaerolineales bacterium]|nr:cytochrome c [Anaerolineales bacterium]